MEGIIRRCLRNTVKTCTRMGILGERNRQEFRPDQGTKTGSDCCTHVCFADDMKNSPTASVSITKRRIFERKWQLQKRLKQKIRSERKHPRR